MDISVNQNGHFEEIGTWLQILQIVGNSTLFYLLFDTKDIPESNFLCVRCLISFIFQNVDTLKMDEKEKANSLTIDAEAETQSQSQSNLENQTQSGSVIVNQEHAGAEFEDMFVCL